MWPEVATSTGSTALATVSAAFADPGTLTIVGIAVGVPLAFYVVKRIIGLFPKSR